jgi:uncharacterized membrane protein
MNKLTKNSIIFLSIIALLISIYLFYTDINQKELVCLINSGCDFVLRSEYSRIFGVPLSLIGILYFSIILILVSLQKLALFLKIILFLGFLFALYLIYLQTFVIKSFCQYCLIVDLVAILIFILSFYLKNKNL